MCQGRPLPTVLSQCSPHSFLFPASPKIRLSQVNKALPSTLTCHATGYYPLDVAVTWTREELGGNLTSLSEASFSSLRQSTAGTYSISSSVTADPGPAGATYTCKVTHVSLEEPLEASMWVAPQGMGYPYAFCTSALDKGLLHLLSSLALASPRGRLLQPPGAERPGKAEFPGWQ